MNFRRWSALALLSIGLVTGCERPEAAWEQAREQDTVAAYQEFLQQFPESPQAVEAKQRMHTLRREQRWEEVRQADTAEAYRDFLAQYPDGPQTDEARARLDAIEAQRRWAALQDSEDIAALQEFAERYGDHPAAEQARQRIAGLEAEAREAERQRRLAEEAARTHRVQLAALRTEKQARAGADRLQQRLAEMLRDTELEVIPAGSYHFIRTAPVGEEDARDLCERLKARNQDCVVVER